MTFKLTGETDGIFQIQPDGLLYHNKSLDRETRAVHRLQVNRPRATNTSSISERRRCHWHAPPSTEPRFHSPYPNDVFANLVCPHFFFKPTREWFGKHILVFRLFDQITQVILPRLSDGSLIQVRPYLGTGSKPLNTSLIFHWCLALAIGGALAPQRRQHWC